MEFRLQIHLVGKRGLYTIASGIKIAYVSGVESAKTDWSFDTDDVKAVRNSCFINKTSMGEYRGIDILLTSQWPMGIDNDDKKTDQNDSKIAASKLVSWLAREIKPRYHFAGLNGRYFERLPYRFVCHLSDQSNVSLCSYKVVPISETRWEATPNWSWPQDLLHCLLLAMGRRQSTFMP